MHTHLPQSPYRLVVQPEHKIGQQVTAALLLAAIGMTIALALTASLLVRGSGHR